MPTKLSPTELRARANAYEECADHLAFAWAKNPLEREAGDRLTQAFKAEGARLRAIANAREFGNPLLAPIGAKGKP